MSDDDQETDRLNLSPEELKYVSEYTYEELLKDRIRGQCLEFHRALKLGYFFLEEPSQDGAENASSNENVSSQPPEETQALPDCSLCASIVQALQFATQVPQCLDCQCRSSRMASEKDESTTTGTGRSSEKKDSDCEGGDSGDGSDETSVKKKKEEDAPKKSKKKKRGYKK